MRFEQDEKFRPVTITLETEKEVMILAVALAEVSGAGVDDHLLYNIYCSLTKVADYAGHYKAIIDRSGAAVSIEEER